MASVEPAARFLQIRRVALGEGQGTRITVDLAPGAPPSIEWDRTKCAECWACVAACPGGVRAFDEDGPVVEEGDCEACCACVDACPSGALTCTERRWTAAEVMHEILPSRRALARPGGGVTIVGSEEELQSDFARDLARRLDDAGVEVTEAARGSRLATS